MPRRFFQQHENCAHIAIDTSANLEEMNSHSYRYNFHTTKGFCVLSRFQLRYFVCDEQSANDACRVRFIPTTYFLPFIYWKLTKARKPSNCRVHRPRQRFIRLRGVDKSHYTHIDIRLKTIRSKFFTLSGRRAGQFQGPSWFFQSYALDSNCILVSVTGQARIT